MPMATTMAFTNPKIRKLAPVLQFYNFSISNAQFIRLCLRHISCAVQRQRRTTTKCGIPFQHLLIKLIYHNNSSAHRDRESAPGADTSRESEIVSRSTINGGIGCASHFIARRPKGSTQCPFMCSKCRRSLGTMRQMYKNNNSRKNML